MDRGFVGVSEVEIRGATVEDLPALRMVFRDASLANESDRAVLLAHPEVLEYGDEHVRAGRTRVAEVGGVVVGFATVVVDDALAELEDLFVAPASMRRGVGRALVADVLALARSQGATRLEVTANDAARAFYETVGFVADGVAPTRFGPAPRMARRVA